MSLLCFFFSAFFVFFAVNSFAQEELINRKERREHKEKTNELSSHKECSVFLCVLCVLCG